MRIRRLPAGLAVAILTTELFAAPIGTGTGSDAETRLAPAAARTRLQSVVDSSKIDPSVGHVDALLSIAARCDDPQLQAAALLHAGKLAGLLGESNQALELTRQAERVATDPASRSTARFNLAHVLYESSLIDSSTADPQTIDQQIERLLRAAAAFRAAYDADPSNTDAIKNMERLRRLARSLQQAQEAMEEQRQRQEEAAEQLERLAEEQERQAEQSQRRAEQNTPSQQGAQEKQQDLSERTEQVQEQINDQLGDQDDAADAMQRARQAQQRAENSLESDDPAQAAQEQREAAEQLRNAAEQLRESAGSGNPEPGEGDQGDSPGESSEQPGDPSGQPGIDPVAEYLLDKEREERQRRAQYIRRSNKRQVERDW